MPGENMTAEKIDALGAVITNQDLKYTSCCSEVIILQKIKSIHLIFFINHEYISFS